MTLTRMQDRPLLGAKERDQLGDRRHDLRDRRQIVAERLAEAARLDEVALHVDDDERGMGGIERIGKRRRRHFDHARISLWSPCAQGTDDAIPLLSSSLRTVALLGNSADLARPPFPAPAASGGPNAASPRMINGRPYTGQSSCGRRPPPRSDRRPCHPT